MSKEVGYGRVSTKDQNLDRQIEAFRELGIDDKYIYNKIKNKLIQDGFIYRCGFCMGLDVSGQYAKYPKNHKH